jgi:hypothetical protein
MTETTVIDEASYKNLKGMLNSTPEDVHVALSCIKALNKQRNYVAIAFLRKHSKCPNYLWLTECKSHIKYQESLGIPDDKSIKFSDIHKALENEKKYKDENKKFFIARYIEFLKDCLVEMDFVESIEITVKIKDYE